jgi:hypothetical protein
MRMMREMAIAMIMVGEGVVGLPVEEECFKEEEEEEEKGKEVGEEDGVVVVVVMNASNVESLDIGLENAHLVMGPEMGDDSHHLDTALVEMNDILLHLII